ncbi:MAG: hypothetical protein OHK0026_15880 [Rhodocyclaceae bacterium]
MKKRSLPAAVILAIASEAALAVQSFDEYFDEAAWQAANPGLATESFDAIVAGTALDALAGLKIEFSAPLPTVKTTGDFGGFSHSGAQVLANAGTEAIRLVPAAGWLITGLGYWNTGKDDRTILAFAQGGSSFEVLSPAVPDNLSFVGMRLPGGADHVAILWNSAGGGNGSFSIDDLQVATAPIPEPGIPAMLLAGLGALAFVRRRARALP